MRVLTSVVRQLVGLILMAIATVGFAVACLLLLPSRVARIKVCNFFGHVMGRTILWLTGTRIVGDPKPAMNAAMPAIYISNHTSPVDIFLGIWLSPFGTCGVAKKEVVYYPFFGQLYLISGHLRIDRGNRDRAIDALRSTGELVRKHRLGIWIWPEGTRSKNGRLLPFKKGFAHMALATGLPVVPVIVTGAHRVWKKGSFLIEPGVVEVRVLPAIDTSAWTAETLDAHVAEVARIVGDALPEDQRAEPVSAAAK